jgi:hypothetical protein
LTPHAQNIQVTGKRVQLEHHANTDGLKRWIDLENVQGVNDKRPPLASIAYGPFPF